jgi:diguanylate cyclase (GGDEF)-like protein
MLLRLARLLMRGYPKSLVACLAFVVAAIASCAGYFYVSLDQSLTSGRVIYSSLNAMQAVATLNAKLIDSDRGAKLFLLEGNRSYLESYNQAGATVADNLMIIRNNMGDLPGISGNVREIARLAGMQLERIRFDVAFYDSMRGGGVAAGKVGYSTPGVLRQLSVSSNRLTEELKRGLSASRRAFMAARRNLMLATAGLILTSICLLGLVVRMKRTELQASREREQQSVQLAEMLRERSIRDALTGLFNRRHLIDTGPGLIQASQSKGEAIVVAMLDIDHFKSLNDNHGHATGDAVLACFARGLSAELRPGEWAFRYGGEEFACVFPGSTLSEVFVRMERFRVGLSLGAWNEAKREMPRITVSIGLANGGASMEASLRAADDALRASKRLGRDRITTAPAIAA